MSTSPPDQLSAEGGELPSGPANGSPQDSLPVPHPASIPTIETRKTHKDMPANISSLYYKGCYFPGYGAVSVCILSGCGGVLTDSEGFFSSPNHPGSYPPNTLCVWVIQATPPHFIQIHVSSLNIEGPSPCLFDWLEVQEHVEHNSVVTRSVDHNEHIQHCTNRTHIPLCEGRLCPSFRFCGAAAPPTVNTNSSTVWVTFRSDGSIAGNGFTAQYRALLPGHSQWFVCMITD